MKTEQMLGSCHRNQVNTFPVFDKNDIVIVKFRDLVLPDNITESDLINYRLNRFPKELSDDFSWKVNPNIINFVDYKPKTDSEKLLNILVEFIKKLANRDLGMSFDEDIVRFDISNEFYYKKNIYSEINFYKIRDYVLKNFTDWSMFLEQPKVIYGMDVAEPKADNSGMFRIPTNKFPSFKGGYELSPKQTFIVMAEIIYQSVDSESEIHNMWKANGFSFGLVDGWALLLFQSYFKKIGFKVRYIFEGGTLVTTKLIFDPNIKSSEVDEDSSNLMDRDEAKKYISDLLTGHHKDCSGNHYRDVANGIDKIYDRLGK